MATAVRPRLPMLSSTGGTCGAIVTDIDLAEPLPPDVIALLRRVWAERGLLIFPRAAA